MTANDSVVQPVVGLVEISFSTLLVSLLPLACVACTSSYMGLQLESPIVVGMLRTFVQLSILGAILVPIFYWGTLKWWIVALYVLFMIILASYEAAARSLYYFKGLSLVVLFAFFVNIFLISLYAFGLVIQPTPVWDPQYVIPIVGMLLGNCINGVALAVNSILTGLVEQSAEIELYLAYGATSGESSARLIREAVRIGAMPILNTMSVIGLISIPGMMTGQILGGSPVQEAARYQMMIVYLIATVTFGTILLEAYFVRRIAFTLDHRLDTSMFIKRPAKTTFLAIIGNGFKAIWRSLVRSTPNRDDLTTVDEQTPLKIESSLSGHSTVSAVKGKIEFVHMRDNVSNAAAPHLDLRRLSRTIPSGRTLFRDMSLKLESGDIVAVRGPSGTGKSQLLRLVAGLVADNSNRGQVLLHGSEMKSFGIVEWRRRVKYVSQYKIDIPGTPTDFLKTFLRFGAWRQQGGLSLGELMSTTTALINEWGMDNSAMDAEWKQLSGGESQRVFLAISIASKPQVLLMDECTSALDSDAKLKVEESIMRIAAKRGIAVMMITHDEGQMERMTKGAGD